MKTWLKGGLIGVAVIIIIIILGFILSLITYSLIDTTEFGEWNQCGNSVNSRWTYEEGSYYFDNKFVVNNPENIGQMQQQKIIKICGNMPVRPYKTLGTILRTSEHILKTDPFLILLTSFIIGAIIGLIIQKIKK